MRGGVQRRRVCEFSERLTYDEYFVSVEMKLVCGLWKQKWVDLLFKQLVLEPALVKHVTFVRLHDEQDASAGLMWLNSAAPKGAEQTLGRHTRREP